MAVCRQVEPLMHSKDPISKVGLNATQFIPEAIKLSLARRLLLLHSFLEGRLPLRHLALHQLVKSLSPVDLETLEELLVLYMPGSG